MKSHMLKLKINMKTPHKLCLTNLQLRNQMHLGCKERGGRVGNQLKYHWVGYNTPYREMFLPSIPFTTGLKMLFVPGTTNKIQE